MVTASVVCKIPFEREEEHHFEDHNVPVHGAVQHLLELWELLSFVTDQHEGRLASTVNRRWLILLHALVLELVTSLSVVHVLHLLSLVEGPFIGIEDEVIRLTLAEPLTPRPRSDVERGFVVNLTELLYQEIVNLEFGSFICLNFVYFFSVISPCELSGFHERVIMCMFRGLGLDRCYRERTLFFALTGSGCLVI